MDERRVGFRRPPRIEQHGQRLDLQRDGLGSVARLLQRVGHDKRDGLAGEADPAVRQGVADRHGDGLAVAALDRQAARDRPAAELDQILRAQDETDAGHGRGGGGVESADIAMGFRRAQDTAGERARDPDIVGITPAPGQQPPVFLARRPVADAVMPFPAAVHDPRSSPTDERRPPERRCAGNIAARRRRGESWPVRRFGMAGHAAPSLSKAQITNFLPFSIFVLAFFDKVAIFPHTIP